MLCIFCKADSAATRSVEHIIPESLGNTDHVLPVGVVCDGCNQYFARKVERPLLESGMFRLLRADRRVPSKRGRIPTFGHHDLADLPDFRLVSRFIGKVGLEALVHRTQSVPNWNQEIVEKEELDPLRDYVRFNKGDIWPVRYRTLYPVNATFHDSTDYYEVLHEYDLLYTSRQELYIIVAIFGVEFALNIGGRQLDGYDEWLRTNVEASPLYVGKNA
ncbi:MAG: hypothetical protein BMS9Abin02_1861 [Anaerolineae bacterium]|nr:MAG: hypothetical protein BMS9Abin02_1861 [Anaerolineae bacterium]